MSPSHRWTMPLCGSPLLMAKLMPWFLPGLPTTHAALYEEYKDKLVDLGPNLEGVKTGRRTKLYGC